MKKTRTGTGREGTGIGRDGNWHGTATGTVESNGVGTESGTGTREGRGPGQDRRRTCIRRNVGLSSFKVLLSQTP